MWERYTFETKHPAKIREILTEAGRNFDPFCLLDSCDFYTQERLRLPLPYYHKYDCLAALGATSQTSLQPSDNFKALESFCKRPGWKFGYLTYDLKNETETLNSSNIDEIEAPSLLFFIPEITVTLKGSFVTVYAADQEGISKALDLLNSSDIKARKQVSTSSVEFNRRTTKAEYIESVNNLREHIGRGDIYEINFCQELYARQAEIDPVALFQKMREHAPAPFSALFRAGGVSVMSASMERFLTHLNGKLISQPIKGTIKRGQTFEEDRQLKDQLRSDPKERAENVMIVDLVRNDLSKNAMPGSVTVEELFGIYPFPQVHQMISTVSCRLRNGISPLNALRDAFPMGSMTGAPKLRAMELIENYETTKRGIFSGSVGYIDPEGNFDFNVIIRSFIYNEVSKYLSLQVGSAITFQAEAEKEWEECALKVRKLMELVTKG